MMLVCIGGGTMGSKAAPFNMDLGNHRLAPVSDRCARVPLAPPWGARLEPLGRCSC